MKKGDVTLMILADFLKAFNTLQYKILITKLHSVGFSKSFLSWLTSYLLDRSQFVQIDDQHPSPFLFSLVYPRDRYWDPCCSFFISQINRMTSQLMLILATCYYVDDTTFMTFMPAAILMTSSKN